MIDELHAALSRHLRPGAVDALVGPLRLAVDAPGSASPDELVAAFEQLEEALEAALLVAAPVPPV